MADQLYLSLWYPNFRLASLPAALSGVMRQFARIAADGSHASPFTRVVAASAIPIDWTESPVYQRIYVNDERAESNPDTEASVIETAVAEATEGMHEDTAYEFEMRWPLWTPDLGSFSEEADLDTVWRLEPNRVRITGFGPDFDDGSYEQNGHIRVDFGLDTPWTFDAETLEAQTSAIGTVGDRELAELAASRVRGNVEKLLAFTLSVEKHCGISSRLLWTESGEPLAEKLVASLQRLT